MNASELVLTRAKNLKLDECEVFQIQKKITTIRITDSEINEIKQNDEKALGVRIVHQKKILSGGTSNFQDAEKIVDKAFAFASFVKAKNFWKSFPHQFKVNSPIEGVFDKKIVKMSGSQAADLAQSMINSTLHSKISAVSGSLNIVSEEISISNTNGLDLSDKGTYISGIINAESENGNTPVSGIGHGSSRTLDSFFSEKIGGDAKEMCVGSINPKKPEAGEYSIIFEPYSVGELLAFVFTSNFSLKTYTEKKSCFADKLDSKIAVDEFSLMDYAHAPEGLGSKIFDDEGIPTQNRHLIKDGIFEGLYADLFNSYKENKESTGNGLRIGSPMGRSAEPIPIAAPHNMRIVGKGIKKEEMIKETKKGLLVGRLWYTYAVNPTKGDFSCTARSGVRIIENGEIKSPGSSVRIVHNLPIMLQNISAIGNDEKNVLQWASLPSIAPSLRADKIRINPI